MYRTQADTAVPIDFDNAAGNHVVVEIAPSRYVRQIVLQLLERLLDLDQLQIEPPQMAGIVALDMERSK